MPTAFMFNPRAGRRFGSWYAKRKKAKILLQLKDCGFENLIDISGPHVHMNIASARNLAESGHIDMLIVAGGDGMVHAGLNATVGTDVALGIIAVGTGNDTARELGLPVHRVTAACQLLAQYRTRPQRLDCGKIENLRTRQITHFMGVFSQGIDAEVNARANQSRLRLGKLTYLYALALRLARFYGYSGRIDTRDTAGEPRSYSGGLTLVSIANFARFGGGIRIAPYARPTDAQLDLVLAPRLSQLQILMLLPKVFLGRHPKDSRLVYVQTDSVQTANTSIDRVSTDLKSEKTTGLPPAFADGEFIGHGPFNVSCVPGGVVVITPKEFH